MDRELQAMIASIGTAEVALAIAMAGAAEHWLEVVQRRCVNKDGSERKSGALNDPDREGVNRFEQDGALLYCSYLQDLASVARVCAFRFLSTFEQLRDKERVAEPLRAREHRPIGFPRRSGRRFSGSKHFMQY
jgi:hypothetical protein